MTKRKLFAKKLLASVICMMLGATMLAGCGKEPSEPAVEEKEDENALEVPDIKGKEETVGAFTLLVPKGFDAEEGSSESTITLTDEDDNRLVITVVDKKEVKELVKALVEDESFKEAEFSIDGTDWKGASLKKAFSVYAKIGKQTVLVSGEGFKYEDDIPVAVMASLEVDEDAEAVNISSNGGTYEYGDGLYTIEYPKTYHEAENGEFGDLVTEDGKQSVYVTSLSSWKDIDNKKDELLTFADDYEYVTVNGCEGILYTYEDPWGDYYAEFILELDTLYTNDFGDMAAVYIYATGDTEADALTDDFRSIINSIQVNGNYATDESRPVAPPHTADDWYGYYTGTMYMYGYGSHEGEEIVEDITAKVGDASSGTFFEIYSEMDLWDMDWTNQGHPVVSAWVKLEDTELIFDTSDGLNDEAWILTQHLKPDEYVSIFAEDQDEEIFLFYEFVDEESDEDGYYVYFYFTHD